MQNVAWLAKLMREKSKAQNESLGTLLRDARCEREMTQTQAAAHLVRDQTFIARIESGLQQATFVEVEQLAQAYGKQLSDFQTIDQIEVRNRNYVMRPKWIVDYYENLLQNRKRSRKPKRPPAKQRPQKRKRK